MNSSWRVFTVSGERVVVILMVFGIWPGLVNGLIGAIIGQRNRQIRYHETLHIIPILMPLFAAALDRENPKRGFTVMASFIPAVFVLGSGVLGLMIGAGGKDKGRSDASPVS